MLWNKVIRFTSSTIALPHKLYEAMTVATILLVQFAGKKEIGQRKKSPPKTD